jgi:branched-chain amino acid transport system ATP-binding protein
MTALLDARDVSVSYGKLNAVKGVSFAIEASKIVTIIGPNGAGKTTLLKALMGQLPCQGDVRFMGDGIASSPVEERVERGIILVPETRELFTAMPVADNLMLGAYVHRRDRARVKQDLDNVYALFPRLLGLAPLVVREIFRTIARLGTTGVTMLLVEQNARAALETADYGYVLESGEIVHEGKAADLMRDPRVMASYLGKSGPAR